MATGPTRRDLLAGALGAFALAACRRPPGEASAEPWILAPWDAALVADLSTKHVLSLFAPRSGVAAQVEVPIPGHSVVSTPHRRHRAILFAKNVPIALEIDYLERRIVRQLESSPNRLFYGHGAYAHDGRVLYATELHVQTGVGAIVARDAETLKITGEFPSHGASPHDCRLVDGGKVMMVANAGQPGSYAGSSLTHVDVATGRLLRTLQNPAPEVHLTHFAVANDGAVVVSSAPNRNRPVAPGAVFVAPPDGQLVQARLPADVAARIHDETLSVAIADSRPIAAVTVPAGNVVLFIHVPDGAFVAASTLDRPAGVVLSPDGAHFIVGTRQSLRWIAVATLTEEPSRATAQGAGCISHMLIASS